MIEQQCDIDACIEVRPGQESQRTISNTFHGRDIMVPVAVAFSLGKSLSDLGLEYQRELIRISIPQTVMAENDLIGEVLWVDRFGNLITNITNNQIAQMESAAIVLSVGGGNHCTLQSCYGDVKPGELLAYIGSSQHLEIAIRTGSATRVLGIGQ